MKLTLINETARYLCYLSHFPIIPVQIKGSSEEFYFLDALSRSIKEDIGEFSIGDLRSEELIVEKICNVALSELFGRSDVEAIYKLIKKEQMYYKQKKRNGKDIAKEEIVEKNNFKVIYDNEGKLVVPTQSVKKIISLTHKHEPFKLAYRRLQNLNITWKGLHTNLQTFHKQCAQCASINAKRVQKTNDSYEYADDIADLAHADVVHINKELYLAIRDYFSGFIMILKVKDLKKETIRDGFIDLLTRLFIPKTLSLDNAAYFKNPFVEELFKILNVIVRYITARNSRGNSYIERSFRTLQNLLKGLLSSEESQETAVKIAMFIMNNRKQTRNGLTPYELITFRRSTFPVNLPNLSKSQIDKLQPMTKKYYMTAGELLDDLRLFQRQQNNALNDKVVLYKKGDIVLLKNYNRTGVKESVLPAYSTQKFRVLAVNPWTKTYEVERMDSDTRAHRNRFRVHHRII